MAKTVHPNYKDYFAVSNELKRRVEARLKECVAKTGIDTGRINVTYDITSSRLGGEAIYRGNKIRLNPVFLNAYPDDYIHDTVAHEWAHIAAFKLHGSDVQPHGREWKSIMLKIGLPARRCHSYMVPKGVQLGRTRAIHDLKCTGCGAVIQVSKKVIDKIAFGGSVYRHTGCKQGTLVIEGAKNAKTLITSVTTAPKSGSKLDKCIDIFTSYRGKSRKDMIDLFVEHAGCTPAGAATYYNTIKTRYSARG